jgi:hypothetical protein
VIIMPTKPLNTFTHATDATFTSGPANTQDTKVEDATATSQGFIPGQGVDAEAVNYILNLVGDWNTNWISQGTSAADLDAHIIETDANGTASIAVLQVGNTAATSPPILAVENSGATATTITASNSSGGVALAALATGGGVGVSGDVFDTCDAMVGQTRGSGNAVTGRLLPGFGTGIALKGEGSVIGGAVLDLSFDASNPARGLAALQATDEPTAPAAGDVWRRPDVSAGTYDRRGGLEYQDDLGAPGKTGAGKLRTWATPEGVEFFEAQNSASQATTSNAIVLALSLTMPKEIPVGKYVIEWSCQLAPDPLPAPGPADRGYVAFTVGPFRIFEDEMELLAASGSSPALTPGAKAISGRYVYNQVTSPASSDIDLEIYFASVGSTPGSGVKISSCQITALGVFDA